MSGTGIIKLVALAVDQSAPSSYSGLDKTSLTEPFNIYQWGNLSWPTSPSASPKASGFDVKRNGTIKIPISLQHQQKESQTPIAVHQSFLHFVSNDFS